MPRESDPFFPSIGTAAEQVDHLPETTDVSKGSNVSTVESETPAVGAVAGTGAAASGVGEVRAEEEEEEERPLQEVSSLCMSCGGEVRLYYYYSLIYSLSNQGRRRSPFTFA